MELQNFFSSTQKYGNLKQAFACDFQDNFLAEKVIYDHQYAFNLNKMTSVPDFIHEPPGKKAD